MAAGESLAALDRRPRPLLDGIVLGEVGAGARQPVVSMAHDLQPQTLPEVVGPSA